MVNLLDPEVIVLGGGVSNLPGLTDGLVDAMLPYVFSDTCLTQIRKAEGGDSSGVFGAAWLWPDPET